MSIALSIDSDLMASLTPHQLTVLNKTLAYEQAALSHNTRRTYASMWKKFETWCQSHNLQALPASAETIALYLGSMGGEVSFSTLDTTIAAIEKIHEQKGLSITGNQDIYRRVRKGIRRSHKEQQSVRQAKALSPCDLAIACRQMGSSLKDLRDKALLTLAFFGALRRSETVAFDIEHIEFTDKGLVIKLLQSKTSDTAQNVYLSPTKDASVCPLHAMRAWLLAAGIESGPLFRSIGKGNKVSANRLSGHAVAAIMKERFGDEYSGHSLRRGLVTAAAESGATLARLQQHSRHKTANMVLRYVEAVEGFENTSAKTLGV